MQAQVLADFVVENTLLIPMEHSNTIKVLDPRMAWVLYVDGSAGQEHKGARFVL